MTKSPILGTVFVSGLLNATGWPRKKGFLGKPVIDGVIFNACIDQLIEFGCTIATHKSLIALKIIATYFPETKWTKEDSINLHILFQNEKLFWDKDISNPVKTLKPPSLDSVNEIVYKDFEDGFLTTMIETLFLQSLLWGLRFPYEFKKYEVERYNALIETQSLMKQSGINDEKLPSPEQNIVNALDIVSSYENFVQKLSEAPESLLLEYKTLV